MQKSFLVISVLLLFACLAPLDALANKSAVKIEAPSEAAKGSDIVIKLTVTHKGNSALHYTKWLKVSVNGKPLEQWEYSSSRRPDGETFTKEITVKAADNMDITAEASCNLHGSAGPATTKIVVR